MRLAENSWSSARHATSGSMACAWDTCARINYRTTITAKNASQNGTKIFSTGASFGIEIVTSVPTTSTINRLNLYSMKIGGFLAKWDLAAGFLQALARRVFWDEDSESPEMVLVLEDCLEELLAGLPDDGAEEDMLLLAPESGNSNYGIRF